MKRRETRLVFSSLSAWFALAVALLAGCSSSGEGGDARSTIDSSVAPDAAAGECDSGQGEVQDRCALPVCPCFVQSAWCGAGAQDHAYGLDEPCQVPLLPEHDEDVLACDGETWIVKDECAQGCFSNRTGVPDACADSRSPVFPGWESCKENSDVSYGMTPEASDRLRCAGVDPGSITQTVGNAAASAGYHAADGQVDGKPYTTAVDLRTRSLSESTIRDLLEQLALNGFAAWYRKPGYDGWPSSGAPHIHAVFAGAPMKAQLRGQVRDFFAGRDGLRYHQPYAFWKPTAKSKEIVRLLFERNYTP